MSGATTPAAAPALEPVDSVVAVTGIVHELHEDGTVQLDFPTTGGALLGVRLTPPAPAKLGDSLAVDAVVVQADALLLTVAVTFDAKEPPQPIVVDRVRATVVAK